MNADGFRARIAELICWTLRTLFIPFALIAKSVRPVVGAEEAEQDTGQITKTHSSMNRTDRSKKSFIQERGIASLAHTGLAPVRDQETLEVYTGRWLVFNTFSMLISLITLICKGILFACITGVVTSVMLPESIADVAASLGFRGCGILCVKCAVWDRVGGTTPLCIDYLCWLGGKVGEGERGIVKMGEGEPAFTTGIVGRPRHASTDLSSFSTLSSRYSISRLILFASVFNSSFPTSFVKSNSVLMHLNWQLIR